MILQYRVYILTLLTLIMTVADWGISREKQPSLTQLAALASNCKPIAQVNNINGQYFLDRKGEKRPIQQGDELCNEDVLIKNKVMSSIIIECYTYTDKNNTKKNVDSERIRVTPFCNDLQMPIPYHRSSQPLITSPRNTFILEDKPSIEWLKTDYDSIVSLNSRNNTDNTKDWTRKVTAGENKLDYPTDVLALQPGIKYKLTIQSQIKIKNEIEKITHTVCIELMNSDNRQKMDKEKKEIEYKFNGFQKDFELAKLYNKYQLYQKAIEILGTLYNRENADVEVRKLLSQLEYDNQQQCD